MRYLIVFLTYCVALLPPRLRKTKIIALLQAFIKGLQTVNDYFVAFVQEAFYKVSFTGQVQYLEHILNDRYDNTLRRIYIEDALQLQPYLYNKAENRPPIIIYNKSEGQTPFYLKNKIEYESDYDFIFNVPTGILTLELERAIKSLVKIYKIAGKRFSVVGF